VDADRGTRGGNRCAQLAFHHRHTGSGHASALPMRSFPMSARKQSEVMDRGEFDGS